MRFLMLALMVAVGCGDDVSPDQACANFGQAFCGKIDSCAHLLIATAYPDLATCVQRTKQNCLTGLKVPMTSTTAAKVDACASAIQTTSCGALYTRDLPAACHGDPGPLADGAACGTDGQCKSTYCKKTTSDANCGVCAQRSQAGGACSKNDDCDYKLACAGNQQCVAYAAAGASCDATHPCGAPNVCKSGTCTMAGGAGATCSPQAQDCDQTQGLYCNAQSVCTMVGTSQPGGPCGLTQSGYSVCLAGGTCKLAGVMGSCVAPAADGQSCNPSMSINCVTPATCSGGVCTLPDPASCHAGL